MNQFSIRDIENLSGIKAHTLRIWEQRYKLLVAKRKESHQRIYDNEDLKALLRVAFLYHLGYKISKIAALSPAEIQHLVETSSVTDENHEAFVQQLIEAGVDLDKEKFEKTVNYLVLRIGLEKSIRNILFPFLQRIGLLWMTNNVIPAQEHFVSHIIRKKIILATDGLENNMHAKHHFIVFAPAGEQHEIPLLAANYFLRKNNNRTTYFGVNVAASSLEYYLRHQGATHLYAHVITPLHNEGVEHYMNGLSMLFPEKKIILSGPACKWIGKLPANISILRSMDELIDLARESGNPI